MSWISESLMSFDLETTGTDIENDRIVTGALLLVDPEGRPILHRSWLLDPGVPIPEEAAAIHGISTERAGESGTDAAAGIEEMTGALADSFAAGVPLVVMNARYDLSLLDRECRRHGIATLSERLGAAPAPVIDPLVLDKHADRFRKGRRTLQALSAHYGVVLEDAHDAGADAMAAAGVARCLGKKYPALGSVSSQALHDLQVRAAAEQARSFQEYLRRSSDPAAYVEPAWPVIPYAAVPRARAHAEGAGQHSPAGSGSPELRKTP